MSTPYSNSLVVLLAASFLVSCRPEPPQKSYADTIAGLPLWESDSVPDLVIGASDGDEAIAYFADATMLYDGRVVIADMGNFEVRCYDANGKRLWSFGRKGGGPGEFQNIAYDGLGASGDTIVIWDAEARRISWIKADGTFITSVGQLTGGRVIGGVMSAGPDHAVVHVGAFSFPRSRYGLVRDSGLITVFRPNNRPEVLLATSGQEYAIVEGIGGRPGAWSTGYYSRTVVGAGIGGSIYLAATDSPLIFRYSLTGRRIGEIRWNAPLVDASSIRDEMLARAGSDGGRESIRLAFDRGYYPPTLPVMRSVLVDDAGFVWVRPFTPFREDPVEWLVFDSVGTMRARATMPRGTMDIRGGYVLAQWQDEDNVTYVLMHQLRR